MGPVEHDNLAALAERGFRFSMDNLADLAVEPRELKDRGFRFIKVPAELLLSRGASAGNRCSHRHGGVGERRFDIDALACSNRGAESAQRARSTG